MKICVACGIEIPLARLKALPSTQHCVGCSCVERWSGVPVVHHKTGNEVEVVKDRELAQRLQKMSSRGTYGAHRGLNSKGALSPTVSVKSLGIADDVRVAKIRGRAVELFELCGAERAERYLKEQAVSRLLSERQAERIFKEIKEELSPVTQPAQPVSKYNPYGKAEPRLPKPLVSDDVLYLFRNWKH